VHCKLEWKREWKYFEVSCWIFEVVRDKIEYPELRRESAAMMQKSSPANAKQVLQESE